MLGAGSEEAGVWGKQMFSRMVDPGQAALVNGWKAAWGEVKEEAPGDRVKYRGPEVPHELPVQG